MNSILKLILFFAALIALTLGSYFFPMTRHSSSSPQNNAFSSSKIVIISPHSDGIRSEFKRAFINWYGQTYHQTIDVEWLDAGGTSDCLKYVFSEFKRQPGGIGIDLFFGGGTDPYLALKKQGLLSAVTIDSAVLRPIPRTFSGIDIYDSLGYWFGTALSGFGIVYNKWVVDKMKFSPPVEWRDLADRRYYSWVGAADPRNSGTMHIMFELILQAYGWEEGWRICTGLAANSRSFSKGASDIPKMVARGDIAYGLAIDFYGWAEVSEAGDDLVGMLLPRDLTIISADCIAMLKGASHPVESQRFIEFTLSEYGQKLFFLRKGAPGGPVEQELNRMPVRPDLYDLYQSQSNVRQNPFDAPNTMQFDQERSGRRWMLINDLFGIACIDKRELLQAAWQKTTNPSSSAWRRLPITEAQADSLALHVWSDPILKNRILLQWQNFFDTKYHELARPQE